MSRGSQTLRNRHWQAYKERLSNEVCPGPSETTASPISRKRSSRRSGRGEPLAGAAEARPKDQHAPAAGDAPSEAARLDPSSPVVTTIPQGAPLHELDDPPAPSNDVDVGERRALAGLGHLLLVEALSGSPSLPAGFAPPPEEQARLRGLAVAALDAAIADDAASVDAALVTGPPPGWQERVLHKIDEIEAPGPTSRERPRRPPG